MTEALELRDRDKGDGSGESLPFLLVMREMPLPDILNLASQLHRTIDVVADGVYLVTYCGGSPYWWLPGTHGGGMHQIGSRGWCHDCRREGLGFVHHLPRDVEVAVLTCEATYDRVLRQQCESDGQTPAEYAQEVAGGGLPLAGEEPPYPCAFCHGTRGHGPKCPERELLSDQRARMS